MEDPRVRDERVLCRKCGRPIDGEGFGSTETGWEHPFSCPTDEIGTHVEALFSRAEEVERDALYSALGHLLAGWTPDVRSHGTGSCWRWMGRATTRPSLPMSSAEATVMSVARKMRASQTASSPTPEAGA